jgi:hypothetical protein
MGFDSYIAWDVYFGSDVMNLLPRLTYMEAVMMACDKYASMYRKAYPGDNHFSDCASLIRDVVREITLPQHPTAMTPDELLDFAMRFVQDK